MKFWLITDTHLGHSKMVQLCGRPEDFSAKILKNLKIMIAPEDVVIHLGDICMGGDEHWNNSFLVTPGKHWLIRGNHDKKSNSWYMEHGWDFVSEMILFDMFGKKICLSHKPVPDFGYDINVHGHFHNSVHHDNEPELNAIKNDKQKLLAIEYTYYSPVLLETFIQS